MVLCFLALRRHLGLQFPGAFAQSPFVQEPWVFLRSGRGLFLKKMSAVCCDQLCFSHHGSVVCRVETICDTCCACHSPCFLLSFEFLNFMSFTFWDLSGLQSQLLRTGFSTICAQTLLRYEVKSSPIRAMTKHDDKPADGAQERLQEPKEVRRATCDLDRKMHSSDGQRQLFPSTKDGPEDLVESWAQIAVDVFG